MIKLNPESIVDIISVTITVIFAGDTINDHPRRHGDTPSPSHYKKTTGKCMGSCRPREGAASMLHVSLYFKTHRQYYYELLDAARVTGDWEAWLDLFAEAVIVTATQAVETARQLIDLSNREHETDKGPARASASGLLLRRC